MAKIKPAKSTKDEPAKSIGRIKTVSPQNHSEIHDIDVEFILSVIDARHYTRAPGIPSFVSMILKGMGRPHAA